jgi:hypothetical protein
MAAHQPDTAAAARMHRKNTIGAFYRFVETTKRSKSNAGRALLSFQVHAPEAKML